MTLANLSICPLGKMSSSNTTTIHLRLLHQTWNDTFDLPDSFFSFTDIQDYFEFIIKKHETLTDNLPVQICPNKTKAKLFSK